MVKLYKYFLKIQVFIVQIIFQCVLFVMNPSFWKMQFLPSTHAKWFFSLRKTGATFKKIILIFFKKRPYRLEASGQIEKRRSKKDTPTEVSFFTKEPRAGGLCGKHLKINSIVFFWPEWPPKAFSGFLTIIALGQPPLKPVQDPGHVEYQYKIDHRDGQKRRI